MEDFLKALKDHAAFLLTELEFEPFGAHVRHDGEIIYIEKQREFESIPKSYQFLLERFEKDFKSGEVKASAIVLNGDVNGKNSIVIEIFDTSFYKKQVVYSYTINGEVVTFEEDIYRKHQLN